MLRRKKDLTMTTITTDSITTTQIRTLRKEAVTAGDWMQVALCDVALCELGEGEGVDADDYSTLSGREQERLNATKGLGAVRACVDAINAGQG